MGTMASQITSFIIVYSTVKSGAEQRKHQSSAFLAAEMASYAENISIWWRHHDSESPERHDVSYMFVYCPGQHQIKHQSYALLAICGYNSMLMIQIYLLHIKGI